LPFPAAGISSGLDVRHLTAGVLLVTNANRDAVTMGPRRRVVLSTVIRPQAALTRCDRRMCMGLDTGLLELL
jgi:hypothetical protein